MGIVFYGSLLYWLFTALVYYTWLALLAYLSTVVILSGFLALAGWAIHQLRVRHSVGFWLSAPVFWTTIDWLRAHLADVAFPWLGLGHSLTAFPWLVGFADVTGARGVTLWLVAINGLIADWWLAGYRNRWPRRAAALVLVLGIPLGYSLVRWHTLTTRPVANVLVVQPNIPEDVKLDRDQAQDSSRVALDLLTLSALDSLPDIDLIAWPETALPNYFDRAKGWTIWAAALARHQDVALLFGTLDLQRYSNGGFDYYNAALYLNDEGSRAGLYRKHHLVPIVERVPFIPISWLRNLRARAAQGWRLPLIGDVGAYFQYFGGFGVGELTDVMQLNDSGFGVLICYESIFPSLSRRYRRDGADFLVNITNDAWFGRERPWWARTSALYQHPAHLVMRAIENRVGVARSANTGISLFVDPKGRVSNATGLFEPATAAATVETTDGLTIYTQVGDWPGWLAAIVAVLAMLASVMRERLGVRYSKGGH